jgi:hypothetical protein
MSEEVLLLITVFRFGAVVEMYLLAPRRAEVEKRVVMVDNMLFVVEGTEY